MKKSVVVPAVLAVLLCGAANASSVDWIDGIGAVAPGSWSISPMNPSPSDIITFTGPTDVPYGNSCSAEATLGGTPYLSISNLTKTIELKFQGPPPTMCPLILKPAVGFQGDFGPLAAGKWTFRCTNPLIAFELNFTVGGSVIHVDQNVPLTIWPPDGSSWLRAYPSLQDGLAAAQPGDTVRVADGMYVPDDGAAVSPGDRAASFQVPDGVTVLCSYAGYGALDPDARDVDLYPTVLSGDLNSDDLWGIINVGDNSYHVVSSAGSGVLDGAIVTAGNANGSGNDGYGGGVLLESSNLKIDHCQISGNKADFGAGIACLSGMAPVVSNTEIGGNWAYIFGGCLYNDDANVQMVNCLITGNTAGQANILGSDAILNHMGSLDIINSTIADNRPGHALPANGRAIVNLIWGPGFVDTVSIKNSIIRNGGDEIWSTEPGVVTLYYNNIEGGPGGYAGLGNIDADPLFNDPGVFGIEGQWYYNDDSYMLLEGSPSIDAGNQSLLPPGVTEDLAGDARVQGADVEQGAYEGYIPSLPPAVVLVPNVVGQTQASAQSTIASYGLVVGVITNAYSSTVPAGRVISQDPAGGSTAVVGSAVDLTISLGPAPGPVWSLYETSLVTMVISSPAPSFPISVSGSGTWSFVAPGATEFKIEITPVPAVGGAWTITPSSGPVTSGTNNVNFTIQGANVDVSSLPAGEQTLATVQFYTR